MRGLRFKLRLGRGRVGPGASFSLQFTGLADDVNGRYGAIGNHASIGYTVNPAGPVDEVKWSNTSNTGAAAAFGTGANPTDFTSVDGFLVYLHVRRGAEWVTTSFEARKAPAVFGADLDLAFGAGSAITPQNMLANLTANGNTLSFVSVTPALPSALSISSGGSMSGTPASVTADATYTATWEDTYFRPYTETFTLEITPVAQLTAVDLQAQLGTGEVPVALTGDNGTYFWVLVTADPAVNPPSRAQVLAGQNHTGAAAPAAGSVVYTGSTVNVNLPGGLLGNYYLVIADGDSVLFDGTPQAIDSTAPVLSSPTGTQTGQTTADGTVTSDTAAGTLYAGVWPTASTPTAAEVVAGTGAVYHTSDATPTAGVNSFAATGLTASTAYKWHYVQDDEFSQRSTVSTSAEFTTASASVDATLVHTASRVGSATTWTITGANLGATAADREFLAVFSGHYFTEIPGAADWECEVNGVTQPTAVYTYRPSRFASHFVFRVSVPSGTTGDVIFRRVAGSAAMNGTVLQLIRMTGSPTLDIAGVVEQFTTANNVALTLSQNVLQGSAVVAGWASSGGSGPPVQTFAGLTETISAGAVEPLAKGAFNGNIDLASPRVMTITESANTNPGTTPKSAFSLEIRA